MDRLPRLRFSALCALSILVSSVSPASSPLSPSIHLPGRDAALDVTKMSPAHTSILLHGPEVAVTHHTIGYENFEAFSIAGEPSVPAEGSPTVPMIFRYFRIPNTGSAELVIGETDYDVMDNINALPFQYQYAADNAIRDAVIYATDNWYPASVATMTAPMIMRDFRVVGVTLYPVQVNPVTHQARIRRNLHVDIVANDFPGENEITQPHRPSGAWAASYRSLISNLDESALDDVTHIPGTYMILRKNTPSANSITDSLFEWKTRKGYRVLVDSRATWSPTQMQLAIQTAWNASVNSPSPLEFVCLMGDPAGGFGVPSGSSDDFGGDFDHIFGLCAGNDDLQDVGVGRLSGSTNSQYAVISAKILAYERDPEMVNSQGQADTMWFHKSLLWADTGLTCVSNFLLIEWAASQFSQFTSVDSSIVVAADGLNPQIIGPIFDAGISFFAWRGSSGESSPSLPAACNSGRRLPVTIEVTCRAGNFVSSTGMAEAMLTEGTPANLKGGICGIGTATIGTHNQQNVCLVGGFLYSVINLHAEALGNSVIYAKDQLYATYGSENGMAASFSRYFNLMGDPGLSVWTDVPTVMNVSHPQTLAVGAHGVDITVLRAGDDAPIPDAMVCLWKRGADSVWVRGMTDMAGHISFPIAVGAPGILSLTVTKQNHKPYLFEIACGNSVCMPMVCDYTLDDDEIGGTHGNDNGVMNPGETIDLPVYLKNYGESTTATNINATLTSGNPHVQVVTGDATWQNLSPGDSLMGSQPFRVQVSQGTQNRERVALTISVSSNVGQTTGQIELGCMGADLGYTRHHFTDGLFLPGTDRHFYVTVTDTGLLSLSGAIGHLQSLSPYVTVPGADAVFGNIAAGALDSNVAAPFQLRARIETFNGHQAPMMLTFSGENGFVDAVQFTVSVGTVQGTDPAGPDAYGYYAYDNIDTTYELHPTFHYVNISQAGIGEDLNLHDPGDKTGTHLIYSTARRLPFPFRFYGRTYDTLTICSNGWVAFGDQSWYDGFRNYPIPAQQAPSAMIAPYWDDLATYQTSGPTLGVYAYHDADSGRYIVQWKAETRAGDPLDFEVMLYDSISRPSMDGNGHILFQYNQVVMNAQNPDWEEASGCTIGIQAQGGDVGLPIVYAATYEAGAGEVTSESAILFTTDARELFGQIEGHVRDAQNNQPLSGVVVRTDHLGFRDTTDAQGYYHLQDVVIGTYRVMAHKYRFNQDTSASVLVELDSTVTLDFAPRHPEMRLSANSVVDSAADELVQTEFQVINDGNGSLDFSSQVFLAGDENLTPWDSVGGLHVTEATSDVQVWGCEFLHNQWWLTGANGPDAQNVLYRFDRDGTFRGFTPQPSSTQLGWFDLATDGQYLYGSDGPGIVAIDTNGQIHDTIPSPLNPSRAIAYDPLMDHFWVTDYNTDFYEIDRLGNVIQQITNGPDSSLATAGLAWDASDPGGYKLYVFSRNGGSSLTRVTKIHPASHQSQTVTDLSGQPTSSAGGCTITTNWNSALRVFAAVVRTAISCRMEIREIAFDQSWITLAPASASVPGVGSQTVTVSFNPARLNNATYNVITHLTSVVYDTLMRLPITLVVQHAAEGAHRPQRTIPTKYALRQNYPNPFNSVTDIQFDLPEAQRVRLQIYNSLGQEVATLVNELRTAGEHTVRWDGGNYASGLYLCRIEAGRFVEVRKLLLMK